MKRHQVILTPEARDDIEGSFRFIYEDSPLHAARWLNDLYSQVKTLERFPERCPHARERDYYNDEIRQLIFKSHRIVFFVDSTSATVYVLHVRHAKRRAVGEPEEDA